MPEFNKVITDMAMQFYRYRRGDKKPKPAQLKSLVSYILSELPTISHGIQVDGTWIDAVLYPTYSATPTSSSAADGNDATSTSTNSGSSASVGIGSIWNMLADMRGSEACSRVFAELDAASGLGAPPEGRALRTIAIDALFAPKPAAQLPKAASTSDLSSMAA